MPEIKKQLNHFIGSVAGDRLSPASPVQAIIQEEVEKVDSSRQIRTVQESISHSQLKSTNDLIKTDSIDTHDAPNVTQILFDNAHSVISHKTSQIGRNEIVIQKPETHQNFPTEVVVNRGMPTTYSVINGSLVEGERAMLQLPSDNQSVLTQNDVVRSPEFKASSELNLIYDQPNGLSKFSDTTILPVNSENRSVIGYQGPSSTLSASNNGIMMYPDRTIPIRCLVNKIVQRNQGSTISTH